MLLAVLAAGAAPDDEPEVSVTRYGNTVQVKVLRDDGQPVVGYPVRVRDQQKKVLAEGHSNANGLWECSLPQAGTYEVLWGKRKRGQEILIRESAPGATPTGPALLPCCQPGAQGRGVPPPPLPSLLGMAVGGVLAVVGLVGLATWAGKVRSRTPHAGPTRIQVAFLTLLVAVGLGTVGWTVAHALSTPPGPSNLAEEVQAYLDKRGARPLSGALERLLVNPEMFLQRSQPLPLVAEQAPDFELSDHRGKKWHLQEQLDKGPVVVIFYYGYYCDHCVSQLFDVAQDIRYFHELGAEVVAISSDPPETTREQFKRFGAFDFPVLSDPDNKVAQAYGVFTPADGAKQANLQHGTFVIDRQGTVQWAYAGPVPFSGNRTLLYQVAKLEDRLPLTPSPLPRGERGGGEGAASP